MAKFTGCWGTPRCADILERYRGESATLASVAAEIGVSPHVVGTVLRKHDIEIRPSTPKRGHVCSEHCRRIVASYAETRSSLKTAELLGVSPGGVGVILRRHGIPMNPWRGHSCDARCEQFRGAYAQGESIYAASRRLGFTQATGALWLRHHGIAMRPGHGRVHQCGDRCSRVVAEYGARRSISGVARALSLSFSVVDRILARHGPKLPREAAPHA